jgi:hypothetical protein
MPDEAPVLVFFRNPPANLATSEFLANSMQSLETSFVLAAARRYVHAFVICASAIEGALRAVPVGSKDRDDFKTLIRRARNVPDASPRLKDFPLAEIDALRKNRNRIIHRGYSPKDNSICVDLLISVALPLLEICYGGFHSIDLYADLRKDHAFAHHLSVAAQVCSRARAAGVDLTYCIGSFAHLVRLFIKPTFTSDWESETLDHAESNVLNWDLKRRDKNTIERWYGMPWTFDCPVCDDFESLVCDLETEDQRLVPKQMACANCNYIVHDSEPFIAEVLLREQLTEDLQRRILKEYGLLSRQT